MINAIISLTTIPTRIEHIEPCIDSLLAQGLPVYLWAQKKNIVTGEALQRIPPFLNEKRGLTVTIVDERGPITKLLPAFEDGQMEVITADDDHAYGKNWAAGLIEGQQKNPGSAICYRGRVFDKSKRYKESEVVIRRNQSVDLITSVWGVFYRRDFFSDAIFQEWTQWNINDDIVVSAHLKRRKIPMLVICVPDGCNITRLNTAHIDPLYAINVKQNKNDEGLKKVYWK